MRRAPPAGRWALAFGALLLVAAPLAAEEFSLVLDGRPAADAVAFATRLAREEHELPPDEPAAAQERVSLALVDASPAAVRQALAHALGRWWVRTPEGRIRYVRAATLPTGPVLARTRTSGLIRMPALEELAHGLMTPWLGASGAGLVYEPSEGLWTATLDTAGHARLLELLTLLERPASEVVPALIPGPQPPADRVLPAFTASGWSELTQRLAALGIATSLAEGLPAPTGPLALPGGPVGSLPQRLAALGAPAAWHQGVLCLAGHEPVEREHPAQRRRLALVPVPHLAEREVDGPLLVQAIRRRVAPTWWRLPGAGLVWMPEQRALLVAADAPVIHAVLDLLDSADRFGLDVVLQAERR